jgi:hypothetical protein
MRVGEMPAFLFGEKATAKATDEGEERAAWGGGVRSGHTARPMRDPAPTEHFPNRASRPVVSAEKYQE